MDCKHYENFYKEWFIDRLRKLCRVDAIRALRLLELMFYVVIFSSLTIVLGIFVNRLFPDPDPDKAGGLLFLEILLQVVVIALLSFYIIKLGKIIPFPPGTVAGYCPGDDKQLGPAYGLAEGILFVGTQSKLFDKLTILSNRWK